MTYKVLLISYSTYVAPLLLLKNLFATLALHYLLELIDFVFSVFSLLIYYFCFKLEVVEYEYIYMLIVIIFNFSRSLSIYYFYFKLQVDEYEYIYASCNNFQFFGNCI